MKLTPEIIARVDSRRVSLTDPCIICGIKFTDCEHTVDTTETVFKEVRALTKEDRKRILGGV